jgi:hypothetical protein
MSVVKRLTEYWHDAGEEGEKEGRRLNEWSWEMGKCAR